MSVLAPTRLAAFPVADRKALMTNVVAATTVTIPVEARRDLVILIWNAGASDYGGAALALLGKSLADATGNWLSASATGYLPADLSGNTIALKKGLTTITIPYTVAETMKEISVVATGNASYPLTVYTSWRDIVTAPQWRSASAAAPVAKTNAGDKHWRITVVPKGLGVGNTVQIKATAAGVWSSTLFKTAKYLQPASNLIDITEPTVLYLNNIFDLATFVVTVQCGGTATADVLFEPTDQPQDVSALYSTLFETTATIGSGNSFTPEVACRYIMARVKCTMTGAGSASVRLFPRTTDGTALPYQFGRFGGLQRSNIISFTASGETIAYLPRSADIAQINADCTIAGTATVLVAFANNYNALIDPASVTDGSASLYRGDGFDVRQYRADVLSFAALENWEAWITTAGVLTVSNGVTRGSVALTALPGWKSGDTVGAIGFIPYKQGGPTTGDYSRETAMRLCFWTNLGNVYHNYPATASNDSTVGGMLDFDLSAIYEPVLHVASGTSLSSERIPSTNAGLTADEKKLYRYEPGLPSWNYLQHTDNIGGVKADASPYGGGGLPPTLTKGGVQFIRMVTPFPAGTNPQDAGYPWRQSGYLSNPFSVKPKCTTYVSYNALSATKHTIFGTVDGGRIWTVLHELGSNSDARTYGNNFDYSAIGAYVDGALSVVKRSYIYPTLAVKDPPNAFRYGAPVSVKSITTSGGKATIETTAAHGYTKGDLICFKKNASGNYDFLENVVTVGQTATFDSNSAGDGRFYRVGDTTTLTFDLRQNFHGVDEKIACHHIHSGNPAKDGVIVACGEKYPQGWIMFIPIEEIDDFSWFDMWNYRRTHPYIYRLNSAELGTQRAVGIVWKDDADQTLMFASDESKITQRTISIAGRDPAALPHRTTAGLFSIPVADIDDFQQAVCVLEMEESSLGIINQQGFYCVIGMSRKTYLSRDGVDWISFPLISRYVGETTRAIYLWASNVVYRVAKT